VVEDQEELRRLYVEHLALSGFEVIEAANGEEAISHTSSHAPDVVLMDLSLPILDGWEATRRLKADSRTAHIPVVALTAHDGSGELQRATRAGCDWFVQMATCPIRTKSIGELKTGLYDQYHVEIPCGEWQGMQYVRVSIQAYNTEADVDRLLEGLGRLL